MVVMRAKDLLGRNGEALAAGFLENQGMRIVDRNWRCPDGEIDIVALEGDTLVIAEVKTRKSLDYGHPFEAVDAAKLARLHRLSSAWCREHDLNAPRRRIDVVSVIDSGVGEPQLEHLRGVG
ncbi:YraN family protein [Paenarthrobacter nitroguajacolicus]|uniref:YraN family protein n=1 Tax=Paenarthrobacter nitroguajacolicus TaxID=211146 RepID=UPI000B8307A0|nr:YraN family protein [Paenarthrobacter nitroguajacolicus]NWL13054.1 YraN family protein [Paenarthrobacter nitroguajacolicus]NWL32630.1 YraN family protein [Paenarthrobacter nitroguajacolicus]